MQHMSKFDWSDLDAHLLQLLVAVVECGSITGAAQRLGVTQSAVSHLLDKLRQRRLCIVLLFNGVDLLLGLDDFTRQFEKLF